MTNRARFLILLMSAGLFVASAFGQRTTATLLGIVQDPTGAVVPGVTIELTNQETNTRLTAVSNDVGEFTFSFVPIGRYNLKAEITGFKTHVRTGLELASGQQIRYPVQLEIGEIRDQTTVVAEAPLLQTASATTSTQFSRLQLSELPQGRRDFATLLSLEAGIKYDNRGQGLFSVNGLAPGGMSITVDGVDASGDPETPAVSAFQGFNNINVMSQEAIQEVVVSKDVISAEIGRTFSANINVISKGGTNKFHGSLFETFQNDALNARYAWSTAAQKTPVRYNQFGGSIGGPIVKDKAFFFFTYEGYRQRSSGVRVETVPTKEFKQLAVAAIPSSKAFMDLWPDPTEPYKPGAASAQARYVDFDTRNDNHFVARGDWNINSTNVLAIRYTAGNPNRIEPRPAKGNPRTYWGENDSANVTWTRASSTWTNELRTGLKWDENKRVDTIHANGKISGIRIDGHFRADGESLILNGHFYSFEDVFVKTVRRHTLKFGAMYVGRAPGRYDEETPIYRYGSPEEFLANTPKEVQFTFGQPSYHGRLWELSGFVQDDFRLNSNLVLNLGVRYDYFSVFSEKDGMLYNPGTLQNAVKTPAVFRDPDSLYNADKNNLQPRVGFAWGLGQKSKTVVRSGFGITVAPPNPRVFSTMVFYSPLVPWRQIFSKSDAAKYKIIYPMSNEQAKPIVSGQQFPRSYEVYQENNPSPYAMQWKLDIQRQITPTLVVETGYIGNKTAKVTLSRQGNLPDRITGLRPVEAAGAFQYEDASDFSYYHGWQSSIRKTLSHNVAFGANYTWSKAMALSQGDFWPGNNVRVQDDKNMRADIGPTDNDRAHRFSSNWVYEPPIAGWLGLHGPLAQVLGGWKLGAIFNATTGRPIYVEQVSNINFSRPDWSGANAYSTAPDPGAFQKWWLNPSVFTKVPIRSASGMTERPGTLGKNVFRAPGSWDFDLSVVKEFKVREVMKFQVRGEFLNALNHPNLGSPVADLMKANFGIITGVSGARVIQLSMKVTF
jgi:hypothetical protein